MESSVDQIAGNQVDLGLDVTCSVVVAKDHLIADSRFNCEDEQGGRNQRLNRSRPRFLVSIHFSHLCRGQDSNLRSHYGAGFTDPCI